MGYNFSNSSLEGSLTPTIIHKDRRGSDSVKWGIFGDDVLPLWVADTDFASPDAVIQTMHERVDHAVFGYPLDPPVLAEIVVDRMMQRYGWQLSAKDMLFVPGVVPGFNLAVQAVTHAGESMVVQPPVYPPILAAAENAGAVRIQNSLVRSTDGSYVVDFDALEAGLRPDTRCFLLCNPHNPVGKVFTRTELEKLAEICLRHDLVIISDEIHSDLIFNGQTHIPIANLSREVAERTVTLIAPSKTFNIAGLESAVLLCQDHSLLKKINHSRRGLVGGVNLIGLAAAVAAYRDGDAWLAEMLRILEENRDFLDGFIRERLPLLKMRKPDATYLAWLDCEELGLAEPPAEFFLRKARVALNEGADFGAGGDNFVRLNFGCSKETLRTALERMENAIRSLK